MAVMVDHEPLAIEQMGLRTVGQVLAHVQRAKRLVTSLLIDGREPDLGRMATVRQAPLVGHTLFIQTAEPRRMALNVLIEVEAQLDEADRLRGSAASLLRQNHPGRAMEKLSGCFSIWQAARESMLKTARLLRIDPERVQVCEQTLGGVLEGFAAGLNDIRLALEHRDFVTVGELLTDEAAQTSDLWRDAIDAVRAVIEAG